MEGKIVYRFFSPAYLSAKKGGTEFSKVTPTQASTPKAIGRVCFEAKPVLDSPYLLTSTKEGELHFKIGIDITGSELVPRMLDNMVFSVAQSRIDRYYPGIMAVCYGDKSAEETIAAVEA